MSDTSEGQMSDTNTDSSRSVNLLYLDLSTTSSSSSCMSLMVIWPMLAQASVHSAATFECYTCVPKRLPPREVHMV